MDIRVTITADEKALEFSRNLKLLGVSIHDAALPGFTAQKEEVKQAAEVIDQAQAKEEQPAQTAEEPRTYTIEEMRAAASQYMQANGREAFKKLLDKYGVPKMSALPEDKQAAFMGDLSNA